MLVALILGLLLLGGVVFYMHKSSQPQLVGNKPKLISDGSERRMESLVELNLLVRNDANRNDEVVTEIENIIDVIVSLLPRLSAEHPNSELTSSLNRMTDSFLPRTVKSFLRLNPSGREEMLPDFLETLKDILKDVNHVADVDLDTAVSEFNRETTMFKLDVAMEDRA